jgi:RNA polymerase sigma factor (sigma-70 family)
MTTLMHPQTITATKETEMTALLAPTIEAPSDQTSTREVTPFDPDVEALNAEDGGKALFDRLGPLVFSYCRRKLADAGRAEEVAQDTFVAAWKSRNSFDPTRASLSTWVMGIARFKVMDAYRASSRTPLPVEDTTDSKPAHLHGSSNESDELADRLLVADALAQLGPRAAEAIRLSFYESMTHDEIAVEMGVPLGTVKSDIRRGLLRLRQALRNRETE